MAIAPTGYIYKALSFDNTTSRNYGVYITGEAVYNAPEREVEMITIPGRNGAFALDHGRFENIEVSYPASIAADTEADFVAAISEFRNFLCSKKGYCRLSDDYNPNEYRMAVYKSGLEVDPTQLRAGEFKITFDCKPQRYLTSGETKQTIAASGDTISNPTLFESSPLLEVEGYGTINVNGTEIEIDDELVGDVDIESGMRYHSGDFTISFDEIYINTGDLIEITNLVAVLKYSKTQGSQSNYTTGGTVTSYSGDTSTSPAISDSGTTMTITFNSPLSFYYGTASTKRVDFTVSMSWHSGGNSSHSFFYKVDYDGEKSLTFRGTSLFARTGYVYSLGNVNQITADAITIHSTATTFGHPTYIDCDLGEAYANDNGVISSLNSYIALGSQLPVLAPGSNTITYDNTITSLKVTPRWWKV